MSEYALRSMSEDDLPLVLEWRNSDRVRERMFTRHEISFDEHLAWFRRMQDDPDSQQLVFEIDGRPVGVVNLTGLADPSGVASWGFYIGPENAPRGSGSRMLALALDRAFGCPGVESVVSEVVASNEASARTHARLGFTPVETVSRDQEGAGAIEVVVYALGAQEWKRHRPEVFGALFEMAGGGSE